MQEEWKDCIGYEGFYQVSNLGRVRRSSAGVRTFAGRILHPKSFKDDYFRVTISINGIRKVEKIHLLVSRAFLGPRPLGLQVNHRDGNKHNNHITNLEYVTRSENCKHAVRLGLVIVPCGARGEDSPVSKLTEVAVHKIRQLYSTEEYTQVKLSTMFNVCRRQIGNVVNRISWTHI